MRGAAALGLLGALGALAGPAPAGAQPRTVRAPAGERLRAEQVRDTALASLVRAEARFMADVAARGADGWAAAFADDGAMFPAGGDFAVGPAAARRVMAPVFADTATHVRWHPVAATVARSGDLGYTYGYYRWTGRDSKGAATRPTEGKFLTVWRRDARGAWKVAADLGSPGPAAPPRFFGP